MPRRVERTPEDEKARRIVLLQKGAFARDPIVALSCRPENEATVREYMEEAGVDLQVILDRNDPDLFTELTEGDIRWSYPEVARERTRRVSRERAEKAKAKAEMADSLRIILHRPKRMHTVVVETGPKGTKIHLGE